MTKLPWAAGPPEAWRLDIRDFAPTWDRGIGAAKVGGRWNPVGYACVYCSADPATAIMEVAVHKGLYVLDTVAHMLIHARILDDKDIHIVVPYDVPNVNWLRPTSPSKGQQTFGRDLLEKHPFVLIPSAVSDESWNLLFNPVRAAGRYELIAQKRFALDTRLNPPT